MANRYSYQFNAGYKPKMANIEGFVSVGTGGLVNAPLPFPLSASGVYTGGVQQTGFGSLALMPGQFVPGVPTGWQGGFSGVVGMLGGGGVAAVQRLATGLYSVLLSDDYVRLDSVQVLPYIGSGASTGSASGYYSDSYDAFLVNHTVGQGNTYQGTGGYTGPTQLGMTGVPGTSFIKDQIIVQFTRDNGNADLPVGGGFYIALRLRDSLAGVQ